MCLSMLAKTYFKAALNNRSIVEGRAFQISHRRLCQKQNAINAELQPQDYY